MAKIDILMATYNGGKYINEQIDSIIAQSFEDWHLIVRDDGSKDNTLQIIESYNDSRISVVVDDVKCGSAQANFMELLRLSTAEFICFCDQDDIWIENKLTLMLDFITTKDNSKPQLIFSDGYLYYGEKQDDLPRLLNARPYLLQEQLFCNGGIHGSMSMFNAAMREQMLRPCGFIAMHDHLLTLVGCAFNGIGYLEQPTFYYRQHQDNITPHPAANLFNRITKSISENRNLTVIDNSHYKGVEAFYKEFSAELSPRDRKLCELYLGYEHRNSFVRFGSIVRNNFSLNNSKINLYLKILLRRFN